MTDLRHFRKLARNWNVLGETDPMFGVLSDPTKYDGKWDPSEFFDTGRAHVDHMFRVLSDHGVDVAPGGVCLDFGCGVGRLTVPLSERFARTIGLDVAPSMVEAARRYAPPGSQCEFVTNRTPDLRQFSDATFDFVHSCLVLQHIPPEVSVRYVQEFLRVTTRGGLVVFQMPAETRPEHVIYEMQALPESACNAAIVIADPPQTLEAGERAPLRITVTNRSPTHWRSDIPGGYHICIANHWLHEDGSMAVPDDGRAFLPRTLEPGETVEARLTVEAPKTPGRYLVEVDLVQERVRWFAEKGSQTACTRVSVAPAAGATAGPLALSTTASKPSFFERIRRRFRRGAPTFEMHSVPRQEIERVVRVAGGDLLHAIDDNAAGASWLSYTYVCRRR